MPLLSHPALAEVRYFGDAESSTHNYSHEPWWAENYNTAETLSLTPLSDWGPA